jgi:hypothetical protein
MAEAHGVEYVECSAKTGQGVQEVIERLARRLAGDWRSVPGMETPNYVPADAFFTASTGRSHPHQQPQNAQHKAKKESTTCSLQ